MLYKTLILCLLASIAFAQRQSIVVLPSIADPDTKLSPRELELLTEKVRSIIPEILPLKDFNLLKQDAVLERLGAEGLFAACKEGSCVGDLVARVQADFGARCEVINVNKQLYLKFELYGTLRGEKDAGTISQFNDPVKDFNAMLALLDKKTPAIFKKIITEAAPAPTPTPAPAAPALSGNYVAQIVTEPAGAALELNGTPYQGCPKTPCAISLYENRIKLSAILSEHETKDTTVTITMPNQIITIKLKPKVYYGTVHINPAYSDGLGKDENWVLTAGGQSFSLGEVRLLPGDYKLRLTHSCYEDITGEARVGKNESMSFDISDKLVLKQGTLVLRSKRKGRNVIKPVFINGKQAGDTPFEGSMPLCSEIKIGSETVRVRLEQNKPVEYVHSESTIGSHLLGALLDAAGAGLISYSFTLFKARDNAYDDYADNSDRSSFGSKWEKVENNHTKGNIALIAGGAVLALGIGVHIWF